MEIEIIEGKKTKIYLIRKKVKNASIKVVYDENGEKVIVITSKNKITEKEAELFILKNKNRLAKYLKPDEIVLKENEYLLFGEIIDLNDCDFKSIKDIEEYALEKIAKRFNEIRCNNNFPNTSLYFRKMKSRWGVCYSKENKIGLTKGLIHVPFDLIDYVIYHEFCHFKVQNHSSKFYDELGKYCVDYKIKRKALKKYVKFL